MQDDWSPSVDDVDREKDCNNNDDRDGLPHVERDLEESIQAFHNFLCFIQALSRTVAFPSQIAYTKWFGQAWHSFLFIFVDCLLG